MHEKTHNLYPAMGALHTEIQFVTADRASTFLYTTLRKPDAFLDRLAATLKVGVNFCAR